MSLESVIAHFEAHGITDRVITLSHSTATVEEAARAHNVTPGQICKTLTFWGNDEPVLILVAGDRRIDNQKFKQKFHKKARMLTAEEALDHTGHEIGGICPFGLKKDLAVYLDESLRQYEQIIPAAGDRHSAIPLSLDELERYSNCRDWVDVCR